ncbi:cytochrome P450 [Trametes polyzona]|nr:cytochrome P450 [Trametes polyzona]
MVLSLTFLKDFSFTSPDVLAVTFALSAYALWRLYCKWHFVYRTPLRVLPGPPAASFIYGNLREITKEDNFVVIDRWFEQYGPTFKDTEFFMTPRVWSMDPRAINHVFTHSVDYQRPEESRKFFSDFFGKGLVLLNYGEQHRQQRRILNPAFGPAQVRGLTEIFVQKAAELRDVWSMAVQKDGGAARINVNRELGKMTLDIIGLAGFSYDFHAVDPEGRPNELNLAFRQLLGSFRPFSLKAYLTLLIPALKVIPSKRAKQIKQASDTIKRVGMKLVMDKKAATLRAAMEKHADGPERKDLQGRDLLTLLIKANMATDIPEDQKLSDNDVLGRTFLLAGHETTSTATTWALYALTKKPEIQRKLREQLLSVETDTPTMEELSALHYLDNVVRETLRLHAPVTQMIREAKKDDVIPLSEPFVGRDGQVHNEIRIAKGNRFGIPILAMHRSKAIWGEDALEFRPERWDHPPEAIAAMPGVWGHLLTFIDGPRACIGYRFSLIEIKAILFTLIRAFEYEFAVPVEDIAIKTIPLQRPSLYSAPDDGFQLPLVVKPYKAA